MFFYKRIGRLPNVIHLKRNGLPITANRIKAGEIEVKGKSLTIADSAWASEVPPLPMRVDDGVYDVHSYQWQHPSGPIIVCAAICFRPQRWSITRRLNIHTDIRPDLSAGVIVDSAEITIQSGSAVKLRSGLGDGYYPVFANFNFGFFAQSLVVDFKIWELRNVIARSGQRTDEYGIVSSNPPIDRRL